MSRRVIGYRDGRPLWEDEGPSTPFIRHGYRGELVTGAVIPSRSQQVAPDVCGKPIRWMDDVCGRPLNHGTVCRSLKALKSKEDRKRRARAKEKAARAA